MTTVASAPAKITPVANAPAGSGYSTKAEGDGSKSLTSVFIAGKKYTIETRRRSRCCAGPIVRNRRQQ